MAYPYKHGETYLDVNKQKPYLEGLDFLPEGLYLSALRLGLIKLGIHGLDPVQCVLGIVCLLIASLCYVEIIQAINKVLAEVSVSMVDLIKLTLYRCVIYVKCNMKLIMVISIVEFFRYLF